MGQWRRWRRAELPDEQGQTLVDLLVALLLMSILAILVTPTLLVTSQTVTTTLDRSSSATQSQQVLAQLVEAIHGAQPAGWCPSTYTADELPTGISESGGTSSNQGYGPMTTPFQACPDPSEGPPDEPNALYSYDPSNSECGTVAGCVAPALPDLTATQWAVAGDDALGSDLVGFWASDYLGTTPSATQAPELVFAYLDPTDENFLVVAFAPTGCANGSAPCPTDPTYAFSGSGSTCNTAVTGRTCLDLGTVTHVSTDAPPLFTYASPSGTLTGLSPYASTLPDSATQPTTVTIAVDLAYDNGQVSLTNSSTKLTDYPFTDTVVIGGELAQEQEGSGTA